MKELNTIAEFLQLNTPAEWLQASQGQRTILLIDHANCEKKAASTALNLMFRYVDRAELLKKMSQLAREELLHFEQVHELMIARDIPYEHLSPSRYAKGLRDTIRQQEPFRLIDTLVVGAFIEARSCERFAALAEVITDDELARHYKFLLKSESRHFEDYLDLARLYGGDGETKAAIEKVRVVEQELISSTDNEFRFHSGIPHN